MAAFSTAVKLGDLNDFIAPAQACVVSLQGQKPATKAEEALLKVMLSLIFEFLTLCMRMRC
jgi:hypothetical protein